MLSNTFVFKQHQQKIREAVDNTLLKIAHEEWKGVVKKFGLRER